MTRFAWYEFDALSGRHLYAMLRLRADVFVVEQACVFSEIDGRDPLARHLLAWTTDTCDLAGTLRLFSPDLGQGVARIGRVATARDARGRGLGRALMAEAIDEVGRRYGAGPIRIDAQVHLEPFYRMFGFKRISDDYDEDGIAHCAMARNA